MNPSHLAIRNPASVLILIAMTVTLGVLAYNRMPREAAPDIQVPLLIVTLPFPGASPEDVENLVTNKVEPALKSVADLEDISSTSGESASAITLEFKLGTDIDQARSKVREKLDGIRSELPQDVEDPILTEINLSEQPMMIVSLSGAMDLVVLKEVAEDLKKDIEAITGVLEVRIVGGLEREVKVYVDPDKLRHYGTAIDQVANVIGRENSSIPGGTLEMGPTKYLIRVPSEFKTPEEINAVVVAAPGGKPVYVRDLASVVFGYKEPTSRARMDGSDSVSLVVVKRSGENLLRIRGQIKQLIAEYENRNQGRVRFQVLADQGTFVERILRDLQNNIASGFLLVFVVLLVAMGPRNAFFVATAIPLSFLLTLAVLSWRGFTLNFVVLFSLILALGMLVDNAVVVVENIFRHMQGGKDRLQAALDGISEVAVPVTTSTLTTLAAFIPMIAMPGIMGEFMRYLPETLLAALTASLLVALIVNPMLCSLLMQAPRKVSAGLDELAAVQDSRILRVYQRALSWAIRWRWPVIAGVVVMFIGVLTAYSSTTLQRKGVEFFPQTEPSTATITIEAPAGTTLDTSDRYVKAIERTLAPHQADLAALVSNVGQRQGFGPADSEGATTNHSYLTLEFLDWKEWKRRPSEVVRAIRQQVKGLPGVEVKVTTEDSGPPTGPPVNIELRGEDFNLLRAVAEGIKKRIQDVPGLVNLADDFDRSRPEIRVLIDREKAARAGLNTQEVGLAVRTAFHGRKVSEYRVGQDDYDIVVRLDEHYRLTPTDLKRLYLLAPTGKQVSLSEVATIETGPAFGSIKHKNQDRVITVSADAADGTPGPVVLQRVRSRLADLALPDGVAVSYTGENEDLEEMQSFLLSAFFIAMFLIFLVLVTQFNSFMTPFIIMSAVVLSVMGVIMGLIIHDKPFSVMMGGIGVISLAGIVVNNAIVLIDYINQLRRRGIPLEEAVVLAGAVRLRPVLLTAITTLLALIPVAAGMEISFFSWPLVLLGSEGSTFWVPMALAVIYGLGVSTVMTLVIVPVLVVTAEHAKATLAALPTWVSEWNRLRRSTAYKHAASGDS